VTRAGAQPEPRKTPGDPPAPMRENELLEHIRSRSIGIAHGDVLVGPGDDCAVLRSTDGGPALLITVDQLISGVHFDPAGASLDQIARKAVARSVSDIAAMGGSCWASVIAATLPPGFEGADALFDRVHAHAVAFACPAVGGDIAVAPGALGLTVTVLGWAHTGRGAVLRSGARAGDAVWVTGRLGASLVSGRHLSFEPRVREARWLCDMLGERLHAMIDLSDGLGLDADRVARASGVVIELDAESLPRHADAPDWRSALGDGEDYELMFTAPEGAPLPASCPTGAALTRIGRVRDVQDGESPGSVVRLPDGSALATTRFGYEHAAAPPGTMTR